jgi:alkylated DNA repair protein alkB family protein 7
MALLWNLSKGHFFLRQALFSRPRRLFTNLSCESQYPPGLLFWPKYFTSEEQRTLLLASLRKLDSLETRLARKKRKDFWKSNPVGSTNVLKIFAPDELYEFEEAR